jgi:hypothetical protein
LILIEKLAKLTPRNKNLASFFIEFGERDAGNRRVRFDGYTAQFRGAVCATGRRLCFRRRSFAASIIRAWTVVSRSRASCRSAFNPSGLILVKMPRAATGALACTAFALPCRLTTMTPACPLNPAFIERHYRSLTS